MASKSLGTLTIDVVAKTGGFTQGMSAAERQSAKTAKTIERQQRELANKLSSIYRGIGIAAAAAFTSIGVIVKKTTDDMLQMGIQAKQVAMPVEQFSAYAAAAKDADVSLTSFTTSVRTLDKSLAMAQQGSKQYADAFKALGIDPSKIHSSEQALLAISDAMSRYKDDAGKVAVAQILLGRSGTEMLAFLNQGAGKIQEVAQHHKDLGDTVDANAAKISGEYDAAMKEFQANLSGLAKQLTVAVLPALTEVTGRATEMVQAFSHSGAIKTFGEAIATVARNLNALVAFIVGRYALDKLFLGFQRVGKAVAFVNLAVANTAKTYAAAGIAAESAAARAAVSATRWQAALIPVRAVIMSLGGPIGIASAALAAFGATFYSAFKKQQEVTEATALATEDLRKAQELLTKANGDALVPQYKITEAARNSAVEHLKAAQAILTHMRAQAELEKANAKALQQAPNSLMPGRADLAGAAGLRATTTASQVRVQQKRVDEIQKEIDDLTRRLGKDLTSEIMGPVQQPGVKFNPNGGGKTLKALKDPSADNYKRTVAELEEQAHALDSIYERNRASINGVTDAEQAFNDRMADANQLLEAGRINWDAYGRIAQDALEGLNSKAKETTDAMQKNNEELGRGIECAFGNAVSSFSEGLADMVSGAKVSFKSILVDFLKMVEQMIIQWLILKAIMAIGGAMGGTADGKDFASFLFRGGKFATGGNVAGGKPILVGERGTEIFTPSGSGHITPNNQLASIGGNGIVLNTTVNVDSRGATQSTTAGDSDTAGRQLAKMIEAQTKQIIVRATQPGGILWKQRQGVMA